MAAVQTGYSGEHDAFIVRFNAAGTAPVFASYLGGSARDAAAAIALDRVGIAYVAGMTRSDDFPLVRPLQPAPHGGADAFIAKIAPGGVAPTPTGAPRPPEPTPRPSPVCAITFNDVPAGSAYAPAICCLVSSDVISGYDCGGPGEPCPGRYFRPDAPVSTANWRASSRTARPSTTTPRPRLTSRPSPTFPPGAPFWTAVELLAAQTGRRSAATLAAARATLRRAAPPVLPAQRQRDAGATEQIVARSAGYPPGTGMKSSRICPAATRFTPGFRC